MERPSRRERRGSEQDRSSRRRAAAKLVDQRQALWRFRKAALLVGLLAVAVYLNGVPGDFVFDDKLIQRDPRIRGETSFWTIFVTDYWYTYLGSSRDLYRPLTIASYAINAAVTGLDSPGFHLVNVFLHAAFCVLLVEFVGALLADRTLALAAGALFATHPVHVEAVTGIVGRAELLAALFLLAALYLHVRQYSLRGLGRSVCLPAAAAAFFCALLSKETAIVGPGLLVLVDYAMRFRDQAVGATPDSSSPHTARPRLVWELILYVAVVAVFLVIRYNVLGFFIQKSPSRTYLYLFEQPLIVRVLTAFQILVIYLRLLFFPATLSADYSYRQVPMPDAPNAMAIAGMVAAVGLCAAFALAARRRAVPAMFGLGWWALAYSLFSNFLVPLQILVAERVMYLPSVGFCVGLAWVLRWLVLSGLAQVTAVEPRRRYAVAVGMIAVFYGARTFARNFDWRDKETLYAATAEASPDCFMAHFNYAAVLMEDGKNNDLALRHLRRAYEIRQDHYPSLINLGSLLLRKGEPEEARKIALRGLEIRPDSKYLRDILKQAEARMGSPTASQHQGGAPVAADGSARE